MNKILQKCLDELNKEPFKVDKVIGMLETLLEMNGGNPVYNTGIAIPRVEVINSTSMSDEETLIADALKVGPLGSMTHGG